MKKTGRPENEPPATITELVEGLRVVEGFSRQRNVPAIMPELFADVSNRVILLQSTLIEWLASDEQRFERKQTLDWIDLDALLHRRRVQLIALGINLDY